LPRKELELGWYQWEGDRYEEKVKESEYDGNIQV
jgi:hypothetical protein